MRRSYGFWALWGVALLGVSGCALTPKQRDCTVLGGLAGALVGGGAGAGIGPAVGSSSNETQDRVIGIGVGIAAGALVGGVAGYLLCPEEPLPPPPPPPPHIEAPPPPPPPPAPKKIILRGINFDFNKSNIKDEFKPVLDEAARVLNENPKVTVVVEGYTDSIGSDAYNQKLSERRAMAVTEYLTSHGVAGSRLEAVGKGESDPVADNQKNGRDNPEGRAMNRRAELKVR